MAFDILDKFAAVVGGESVQWDSALNVALALSRGSAGAVFVYQRGRLAPVASNLSAAAKDRLERSGLLRDKRTNILSGTLPATVSFLRLPLITEGNLLGVVYLEGLDTADPQVVGCMSRCSKTLAKSLARWAEGRDARQELDPPSGEGVHRVYSGIPARHPEKTAIEEACEGTLRELPGAWMIDILPNESLSGWIVGITGPSFYDWFLVGGPAQQNAGFIRTLIEEALRSRGFRSQTRGNG